MINQEYSNNINRRYSTINIINKLQKYLNNYNRFLIDHKNNIEDAKKNNQFNNNISYIKKEINNLEDILKNINSEVKEKTNYLEQSNSILNTHKSYNKKLKEKLHQLQNTNAGAIGMYNDITEIYKYVVFEYILILLGIIGLIYYSKK
jgi:predicted  nucleic acid-binding Zn-ribbon protein